MNCFEWVILIFTLGFVSMIEICAITTCVGRVLDQKMKAQAKIGLLIFEKEMEILNELIESFFDKMNGAINGENNQPEMKEPDYVVGYSSPIKYVKNEVKPVVEKKTTRKKKNDDGFDILKSIDEELNL